MPTYLEKARETSDISLHPALSADQAAEILGTTAARLADLRWKGGGPKFCKIGRRVIYLRSDLQAFLDERRRSSTADHTSRQLAAGVQT